MARTTIDIDDPILKDLKRLQTKQKKSLGRLVSDLLTAALHPLLPRSPGRPAFTWKTRPMRARVDLQDKEDLWTALESRTIDDRST